MAKYNGQYVVVVLLMFIGNFINVMIMGTSGWTLAITGPLVVTALSHGIIETINQLISRQWRNISVK